METKKEMKNFDVTGSFIEKGVQKKFDKNSECFELKQRS